MTARGFWAWAGPPSFLGTRRVGAGCAIMSLLLASPIQAAAPPNPVLDRLLAELQTAPDERAAQMLELRIHEQWRSAGSPAAKLLLESGVMAIQNTAAAGSAIDEFDAALDLEPDYAEAYGDRAAAHLAAGEYHGAALDAAAALQREPRHFDALRILSQVAEARHDWKTALRAWQGALAISPKTPDGQQRLNLLRRNAVGEAT